MVVDSINMIQTATERIKVLLDAARNAGVFVVHVVQNMGLSIAIRGRLIGFP